MNRTFPYSVVRECGVIPSGWVRVAVSRLVEKHFCGPSPDCEERQIVSDEEWGVLKTTAITWDGWNETAHKVLPRAYWGREEIEVKSGDVLVTKAGPRDRVGVVVYVTSEPRHLIVSGKMIRLRLRHEDVLPQVLAGALSLRGPQEYIHARTTGMAESQVNFANEVLLNTEVCIPSLPEQSRIATVLDTVDEAIAKTATMIAKLKQVRAGLLHDLLTRGVDENGQLRDPIAHPEQFHDSSLGRIPRAWEISTVRELDLLIIDGDRGSNYPDESQLFAQGFCVFLNNKNIVDGNFDFSSAQFISRERDTLLGKGKLSLGDIVITTRGTVGNIAFFRELNPYPHVRINSGMVILRAYQEFFVPQFFVALWTFLFPSEYRRLSSGSAQPQFPIRDMLEFRLLVPQKTEQERIVSVSNSVESALSEQHRVLAKLIPLKSGLMNDLLTGRVRVPEGVAVTG